MRTLPTREHIEWFGSQYLRSPADLLDFRFSPISGARFQRITSSLDNNSRIRSTRDQGEAYANKLLQAGSLSLTSVRFNNVIHGFLSFFPLMEQGRDAIGLIGSVLRRVFYDKI
ncbi:alpha/beta hydrolase [Saccharolobus solfataricus]|uniref:Alpha/beta hydrolase n=1 Tax=Saccharolobus solfataricus TaxID=2287 RepID=A0A7S9IIF9_SACSO|nr:alpha/beta hydrolase [Saccharolobus solfataricus]QPG49735.1 alpha/beta hydrolase [Saccharolobus solfataricus]